jgi:ketosteroid isomerase-like protein
LVTAVHHVGRTRGSDDMVRNQRFHAWTFRDGKVVRWSSHPDRRRALEAACLREQGP